jgi:hypothetical protein
MEKYKFIKAQNQLGKKIKNKTSQTPELELVICDTLNKIYKNKMMCIAKENYDFDTTVDETLFRQQFVLINAHYAPRVMKIVLQDEKNTMHIVDTIEAYYNLWEKVSIIQSKTP